MSKFSHVIFAAAIAAGMSLVSYAEVLVYDGFASSAYTIGSGGTGTLNGCPTVDIRCGWYRHERRVVDWSERRRIAEEQSRHFP